MNASTKLQVIAMCLAMSIFSISSFASIDSKEQFAEKFNYGGFSCTPSRFIEKSGLSGHYAFSKGLPSKAELKETFDKLIVETVYEGISKTAEINPGLAELIQRNSYDIKTSFFCDYTTTTTPLSGKPVMRAFAFHSRLFGAKINIGTLAFGLVSKDSKLGVANSKVRTYIKKILFHEFLHINLRPKTSGVKTVRHGVGKHLSTLNPEQYDIIFSLPNYIFPLSLEERAEATLLSDMHIEHLGLTEWFEEQIQALYEAAEKMPGSRPLIHPMEYTFDHCLTNLFTRVEGGKLISIEFFESSFVHEIPDNLGLIAQHCGDLEDYKSPHYDFFINHVALRLFGHSVNAERLKRQMKPTDSNSH